VLSMKTVSYVNVAHAQGYVLLIVFIIQLLSGIFLLMLYRVSDDQFGYLCLLIVNGVFNWLVVSIHSFCVNLVFFSHLQGNVL
jgi:quinol-cytochrome oxidoreductase complex cytochrome b subunit